MRIVVVVRFACVMGSGECLLVDFLDRLRNSKERAKLTAIEYSHRT